MASNQDEKERAGRVEFKDWRDPIACQLEDLLFDNLDFVFKSAVKEISEHGYDEQVAVKAISRRGLYVDGVDPIKNIVDDALARLKGGKDTDNIMDDKFDNLGHLTSYTLLEMVGVLREVRPFLSDGEAMWGLLMCDMNILQACRMEDDYLGVFRGKESSEESFFGSVLSRLRSEAHNCLTETLKLENVLKHTKPESSHVPEEITKEEKTLMSMLDKLEKCLGTIGVNVQIGSQTSAPEEEKSGVGRNVPLKREITALLPKQLNLGRAYRGHGPKGSCRSARREKINSLIIDNKPKYIPEIPGLTLKFGSSKPNAELGGKAPFACDKDNASTKTGNSSRLPSVGTSSSSTTGQTKLFEKFRSGERSNLNSAANTSGSSMYPDYLAGIPYDKYKRKYLPRDEKDELILKLVPRLPKLQYEIYSWTEWANYKIMQAARRLTKDQLELKRLRQDPEVERQAQWEIVVKKLPGMEKGLNDIIALVENSKKIISRLEEENFILKKEAAAARLGAQESTARYREALEREQKALKEVRSWEGKNDLLHKDLEMEKKKVAARQQDFDKAKNTHWQMEVRCEQVRMEKEKLLAMAASVRKEREQHEILVKEEEDSIKQRAEFDKQKSMEDIGKLENKYLEVTLRLNASRIAALKRSGFAKGNQNSTSLKKMMNLEDPFGYGGLRQERECVMCLSEEFSVVFVPCSHQVLCAKCNEHHEQRGMKDCPSCRTPILRRISSRFASP